FCNSDPDCAPCGGTCQQILFAKVCQQKNGGCDPAPYAKPEIEIAPLPGAAQALSQSISQHRPSTGTPTMPALQGAVQHAKEWAQAHPGHVTIALLATDGQPEACDKDLSHINAVAAQAAAGTPKILTFVIGVGDLKSALDGIAAAGGTGHAYIVDQSANTTQ